MQYYSCCNHYLHGVRVLQIAVRQLSEVIMRYFFIVLIGIGLSGCAIPIPLQIASLAASGCSVPAVLLLLAERGAGAAPAVCLFLPEVALVMRSASASCASRLLLHVLQGRDGSPHGPWHPCARAGGFCAPPWTRQEGWSCTCKSRFAALALCRQASNRHL